ncbi:MAG: hypothetical protein KA329_09260, partial [Novosphingobium sp.]|nr:hypothetical protein [Novosphingobium sp.]
HVAPGSAQVETGDEAVGSIGRRCTWSKLKDSFGQQSLSGPQVLSVVCELVSGRGLDLVMAAGAIPSKASK